MRTEKDLVNTVLTRRARQGRWHGMPLTGSSIYKQPFHELSPSGPVNHRSIKNMMVTYMSHPCRTRGNSILLGHDGKSELDAEGAETTGESMDVVVPRLISWNGSCIFLSYFTRV